MEFHNAELVMGYLYDSFGEWKLPRKQSTVGPSVQ